MPAASPATAPRKPTARSRVTNGHALLPGIDGRSAVARRYADIIAALVADAGGDAEMSEARRQLIRRFRRARRFGRKPGGQAGDGRSNRPRRARPYQFHLV